MMLEAEARLWNMLFSATLFKAVFMHFELCTIINHNVQTVKSARKNEKKPKMFQDFPRLMCLWLLPLSHYNV